MSKQITYSGLTKILQNLGFELTRVRGSHKVFKHPDSSTLIVLPYRSGREPARRIHIAAVERVLSETGFLSRKKFEELIGGIAMAEMGDLHAMQQVVIGRIITLVVDTVFELESAAKGATEEEKQMLETWLNRAKKPLSAEGDSIGIEQVEEIRSWVKDLPTKKRQVRPPR